MNVAGVAGAGPASPSFFSSVAPPSGVGSGGSSGGGSGGTWPGSTPPCLPLVLSTSPLHQHATPSSSTAGGSVDASSLQAPPCSLEAPRRGTERTSVGERDAGATGRDSSTAAHSSPVCVSPWTETRRESHRGKILRLAQEKRVRLSPSPTLTPF